MSNQTNEVEWCRSLDKTNIYGASEALLSRNDMYPCDSKGNFLASGAQELSKPVPAPVKPTTDDSANAEDNTRVAQLIQRAKDLGVKNPHNCKEETLLKRIAEKEAELADKKDYSEGNSGEGNSGEGNRSE